MIFAARWKDATSQLIRWVREGKLNHRDTIVEALENVPAALNQLFDGSSCNLNPEIGLVSYLPRSKDRRGKATIYLLRVTPWETEAGNWTQPSRAEIGTNGSQLTTTPRILKSERNAPNI